MFWKLEERLIMLSKKMNIIKKTQFRLPEIETTMSKMKILRLTLGKTLQKERLVNLKM